MEEKTPPTGTPREVPAPEPKMTVEALLADMRQGGVIEGSEPGMPRTFEIRPGPTPRSLLVAFLGDDDRPQGRAFFDALDNAAKSLGREPLDAWEDLPPEVRHAYAGAEAELGETGGRRLAEVAKGIARAVNCASFEQAAGNLPDFVAGELAARVLLAVGDAVRKRDTLRLGGATPHELALGTKVTPTPTPRLFADLRDAYRDAVSLTAHHGIMVEVPPVDGEARRQVAYVRTAFSQLSAKLEQASARALGAVQTGEPPTMVIGPSDGAGGVNVPPGATAWGDMGALGARLYAPQALRDVLAAAVAWAFTPSNAESDQTPAALLAAVQGAVESGILPRPLWTANGLVVDAVAHGFDEPDELPETRDVALESSLLGETMDYSEKATTALTAVVHAVRDDLDVLEPDDSDALADALEHVIANGGADLAAYIADLRGNTPDKADKALAAVICAVRPDLDPKKDSDALAVALTNAIGDSGARLVADVVEAKSAAAQQYHDLKRALGVPTTNASTFADLVKLAGSFRQLTIDARLCRQSAAEHARRVEAQHNDLRRALRVPEHANPMFVELVRHVHDVVTKAEELQKKRGLTFRHEDAAFTLSVLSALDVQISAQSRIADAASKAAEEARKVAIEDRRELANVLGFDPTAEPPLFPELVATLQKRLTATSSLGMAPRLRSVLGLTGTESVDECLAMLRRELDAAKSTRAKLEDERDRSKSLVQRADRAAEEKRHAIESRDEAKRQRDAARDALAKAKIDLANAWGEVDAVAMALGVKVPAKLRDVLDGIAKLRKSLEASALVPVFREVADVVGVDLDTQHPADVVSAVRALWGAHADGSEGEAVATLDVLRKALVKIEELHNGASVLLKSAETPEHLFGDAHRLGLLEEAVGMIGCGVSDALDVLPPKGDA